MKHQFDAVAEAKTNLSAEAMCIEYAAFLRPLLSYAYGLAFEDKPDYSLLRHLLVKALLETNETPDKNFDWTFSVRFGGRGSRPDAAGPADSNRDEYVSNEMAE